MSAQPALDASRRPVGHVAAALVRPRRWRDHDPATEAGSAASPVRRVWLVSFVAFFLLGAGWALAMPYDGPPDEMQHVIRAYAVAEGKLYAGAANVAEPVAKSLAPEAAANCFRWHDELSAACLPTPGSRPAMERQVVPVSSGAAGYGPFYYLAVGPVLRVLPTMGGILIARLITDAWISALFATAVAVAWGRRGPRPLVAGVLVCATPVAVNLFGAVNPAGVEIGAAVAFWVCLLDLLGRGQPRTWVAWALAWSGATFAMARGFGPGWLAFTVAVCLLGADRVRLRLLRGRVPLRRAAAVVAMGCAAGVGWNLLERGAANYDLAGVSKGHRSTTQLVLEQLYARIPYYIDGTVRLTSYGDVPVPQEVTFIWVAVIGFFVVGGVVFGTTRTKLQIAMIAVLGFGTLVAADVNATRQGIWFSQGRYALPLLVGIPLVCAAALDRSGMLTRERLASLVRAIIVLLTPLQVVALWVTLLRFEHGVPANGAYLLDPFTGEWLPPFGPAVPLAVFLGGLAVACFAAWRMCGTRPVRQA